MSRTFEYIDLEVMTDLKPTFERAAKIQQRREDSKSLSDFVLVFPVRQGEVQGDAIHHWWRRSFNSKEPIPQLAYFSGYLVMLVNQSHSACPPNYEEERLVREENYARFHVLQNYLAKSRQFGWDSDKAPKD